MLAYVSIERKLLFRLALFLGTLGDSKNRPWFFSFWYPDMSTVLIRHSLKRPRVRMAKPSLCTLGISHLVSFILAKECAMDNYENYSGIHQAWKIESPCICFDFRMTKRPRGKMIYIIHGGYIYNIFWPIRLIRNVAGHALRKRTTWILWVPQLLPPKQHPSHRKKVQATTHSNPIVSN